MKQVVGITSYYEIVPVVIPLIYHKYSAFGWTYNVSVCQIVCSICVIKHLFGNGFEMLNFWKIQKSRTQTEKVLKNRNIDQYIQGGPVLNVNNSPFDSS